MRPNVVVFGPPSVGKSTLVGYMITRNLSSSEFDLSEKKTIDRVKEIGNYREENRFSYFVDRAKNEIRRANEISTSNEEKSFGTSKYIHIEGMSDFVIIDTPGAKSELRARFKGAFLGDIGIFAIEAKMILQMNEIIEKDESKYFILVNEFFSPLLVWNKLNNNSNIIILITKMDEINFEYKSFVNICNSLQKMFSNLCFRIIPIYINVKSREDINVFTKGNLSWYQGDTLLESIIKLSDLFQEKKEKDLLMFVDTKFKDVAGIGAIWRGKLRRGEIHVNSQVKIAPVKYKGQYNFALAKIKSIHKALKQPIEGCNTNEIVSLNLSMIHVKNRIIPKKQLDLSVAAIIVNTTTILNVGNLLDIDIDTTKCTDDEFENLVKIKFKENVRILWFGRIIEGSVLSLNANSNIYNLTVYLLETEVALPVNESGIIEQNHIVIQKLNQAQDISTLSFYNCTINHIKYITKIRFNYPKQINNDEGLKALVCFEQERAFLSQIKQIKESFADQPEYNLLDYVSIESEIHRL